MLFDVLFGNYLDIDINQINTNKRFDTHIEGKHKVPRNENLILNEDQIDFLNLIKVKNKQYPDALEKFKEKKGLNYSEILTLCCNLTLEEIDSLFNKDNFRLVTGAKGFAAEEHFNVLLEKYNFPYTQDKDMYSKVDHWVNGKRVQVKIPHLLSVTEDKWAFKTHKSHGSGVKELYRNDEFDYVALFIGFEMDVEKDRYLPVSVKNEFILIPTEDLPEHPNYPGHLKRVSSFEKNKYQINNLNCLKNFN